MTRVGENGYLLSGSLEESMSIQQNFGVDSYFVISDALNFAAAVSNAIPGCAQVFVGYCNYQPHRIIEKEIAELSVKDFTDDKGNLIIGGPEMNKRMGQMVGNGIDLMFLKEQRHQDQAEFRFVWTINTQYFSMNEFIDISCKEAVQFCERRRAARWE